MTHRKNNELPKKKRLKKEPGAGGVRRRPRSQGKPFAGFAVLLVLLAAVLVFSEFWAFTTWAGLKMDEILYHLRAPLEGRDWDWDVRTSEPMLFLPHTDKYDFLSDARIYELLREWMSYIPIVKSTMRIDRSGAIAWGFVVSERDLRTLDLPVNDVVERIPAQKILYYKFRGPLMPTAQERFDAPEHPLFRLLRARNLTGGDFYFRTTLMPADWQQSIEFQYGYYAIPIGGDKEL